MNPFTLGPIIPIVFNNATWPISPTNQVTAEAFETIRIGTLVEKSILGGPPGFVRTYEWFVSQHVGIQSRFGRWLSNNGSFVFQEGSEVIPSAQEIGLLETFPPFDGYTVTPKLSSHGFRFEETPLSFEGPFVYPFPASEYVGDQTRFFLGLKLFQNGDQNLPLCGWVEIVRDSPESTQKFRFGTYAIDFVPNRSIRAGASPELPRLNATVESGAIILSWDPIYSNAGFYVESAGSLTPPVQWIPIPPISGTTGVSVSDTDSATRFYRLSRSQP